MLIWNLIGDYVKDYLQLFYGDPKIDPERTAKAVQLDNELQAWAHELARASSGPGNVPHFPSQIQDFDTLHRIVRLLIWIAGPRHACVNFPQTAYTAFAPNQPTAIYLLPERRFRRAPRRLQGRSPSASANAASWRGSPTGLWRPYERRFPYGGTEGSNPSPSSSESVCAVPSEAILEDSPLFAAVCTGRGTREGTGSLPSHPRWRFFSDGH